MGGRGGVSFVSQGDGSVVGVVLNDGAYRPAYFKHVYPRGAPRCHNGDGFSDPTGTGGDENVAGFPDIDMAYHMIGTQTLLAPTMDFTQGIFLAGLDKTLADGVEYLPGAGLTVNNPFALTIDSGVAMFLRVKFFVETVVNSAECAVGFRAAAAFDALIDDYTDMAVLNMQVANIDIETILNNAATENVDTGEDMADGVARTLEVRVTAKGAASFFIDGVKFDAASAFSFDTTDVVVPFIHWLQVTGGSDLGIQEIECGPLWMVRKDPLIDAVRGPSVPS